MDMNKYNKQKNFFSIVHTIFFFTWIILKEIYLDKEYFFYIVLNIYVIFSGISFLVILKLNDKLGEKKFTSIMLVIVILASILSFL
ncbi:hypothetical protein [Tepidibacter formicigenes]|uniref:Uncharacterized protein n=1 Tax=Tepidibacter formicigenes DSM 15518 TaxID=1123349 RepID=A0A1M6UF34_9FIRM|nr:hypothetical protein [Tepidibacter formicigenes]SHK67800.1 hypothetical protein SAMN02744037_02788 [Tepidibacter formicigenes DSM 15518]